MTIKSLMLVAALVLVLIAGTLVGGTAGADEGTHITVSPNSDGYCANGIGCRYYIRDPGAHVHLPPKPPSSPPTSRCVTVDNQTAGPLDVSALDGTPIDGGRKPTIVSAGTAMGFFITPGYGGSASWSWLTAGPCGH